MALILRKTLVASKVLGNGLDTHVGQRRQSLERVLYC